MKSRKNLAIAVAGVAVMGILLAGCTTAESSKEDDAPESSENVGQDIGIMPLDDVKPDEEAIALLPEDLQSGGKLTVAMDLNYPPTSFKDAGSEDALGFNADFARLVGKKLGLDVDIQNVGFDTIIPGIDGGRYDFTASNMTPTDERLEKLDMITYWKTGSSILTSVGNPEGLDANDTSLCGQKIAVTKGSMAADTHVPNIDKKCEEAGEDPIATVVLPDGQAALTQLNSKRVVGVFIDTPQLAWAELQQPDKFELVKPQYEKPEGDDLVAVGLKKDSPLTPAVLKTIEDLIDTDEYEEALSRWGLDTGAASLDDVRQR